MTIKIKIPKLDVQAEQEPYEPLTWKGRASLVLWWLLIVFAGLSIVAHSLMLTGNVRSLFFIAWGALMVYIASKRIDGRKR